MSASQGNTDGLAALQARRATSARKRELPKSQNPTTLPPYRAAAVVDLRDAPNTDKPANSPAPKSTQAQLAASNSAKIPSRKVGIYLEEPHEDFLEAVRIAGNALRPRVTLSGSAVVRLAMDLLMADLSAEQVRDTLVAKPLDPTAPGRPRR